MFDVHAKKMDRDIQDSFSKFFLGSIQINDTGGGFSEIIYKDPTGFTTEITSAGSGIVSSFPIIAGVHYVEKGGTLIIEEPEMYLEPAGQLDIIDVIINIAEIRKLDLIFITHSDYIVRKLLALVSKKRIKQKDLGLYYFKQSPKSRTQIQHITVDKSGEAELELFGDALDTLIEEFSE